VAIAVSVPIPTALAAPVRQTPELPWVKICRFLRQQPVSITSTARQAATIIELEIPNNAGSGGLTSGPDGALWFTEYFDNKIARVTTSGDFTEYPIPTANSYPGQVAAGPDGAVLTEQNADKIGRITTTGGTVTEHPAPTPVAGVNDVMVGSDNNIWFTENFIGRIGRLTP
jgi:virginiamycin B lyase